MAEPPYEVVAFALTDLAGRVRAEQLGERQFTAASMMKVAVLIDVFRRHDAGTMDLQDTVPVATEFRSMADGSHFTLEPDEVDQELTVRVGDQVTIRYLAERMITASSNEATNILLQLTGFEGVGEVLADLGARGSVVERQLGNGPARAAGRVNLVTPIDLAQLMTAIARGQAASAQSCVEMLGILSHQQFRTEIPAVLPAGTSVANKTGWVTGILHDAALVWPDDAAPYCLSVCTEGFTLQEAARRAIHAVSAQAWRDRELVSG
ncbi:MAG: serine hydrolase [Candidatus Dormibacteria bacterium]